MADTDAEMADPSSALSEWQNALANALTATAAWKQDLARAVAPFQTADDPAGPGLDDCGRLSVPGVAQGVSPTVTSCSVNAAESTYGGASHGCDGSAASGGANWSPCSRRAASTTMSTAQAPRSHVTPILTSV